MACDICGAKGTRLIDIVDAYKTPDCAQVCEDCESVLNKQLAKVRRVTLNILVAWMKRFISERQRDRRK